MCHVQGFNAQELLGSSSGKYCPLRSYLRIAEVIQAKYLKRKVACKRSRQTKMVVASRSNIYGMGRKLEYVIFYIKCLLHDCLCLQRLVCWGCCRAICKLVYLLSLTVFICENFFTSRHCPYTVWITLERSLTLKAFLSLQMIAFGGRQKAT